MTRSAIWAKLWSPDSWAGRFLVLATLLIVPLIRFLLTNEYSLCRPEVAVIAVPILASSAVLALVCRPRLAFYGIVLVLIPLLTWGTVWFLLAGPGEPRASWAFLLLFLLAALTGTGMATFRRNFFKLVLVFSVATACVDVAKAIVSRADSPATHGPPNGKPLPHVLYIIADEHIGTDGLPLDQAATASTKMSIESMFLRNGFQLFPRAFSNYGTTRTSVPSILSRKMDAALDSVWRNNTADNPVMTLTEDKVLSEFGARGYDIRTYQMDWLRYAPRGVKVKSTVYAITSIWPLQQLDVPALDKARFIFVSYGASDPFWFKLLLRTRVFDKDSLFRHTGALAMGHFWPDGIGADIKAAERPTVFLAHLMAPHRPWVFRSNGPINDLSQWAIHTRAEATYQARYERYLEQMLYLNGQLDALFNSLRDAGAWDSMTVIIHGDHGSRIRQFRPEDQAARDAMPDRMRDNELSDEYYDYVSEPPAQDLLDRFSALLAVKTKSELVGHVDTQPVSVMRVVHETLFPESKNQIPAESDNAYLFDRDGRLQTIHMPSVWDARKREEEKSNHHEKMRNVSLELSRRVVRSSR